MIQREVRNTLNQVNFKMTQVNELLDVKDWARATIEKVENRSNSYTQDQMEILQKYFSEKLTKDINLNNLEVVTPKMSDLKESYDDKFDDFKWVSENNFTSIKTDIENIKNQHINDQNNRLTDM
jgi:predicted transcriptional regulator